MNNLWPSWIEVRLDHLVHNTKEIKKWIGPDIKLLAVVKANGYGHGSVAASWAVLQGGAEILGVNSPPEGIELRQAGISADILVMGGCFIEQTEQVVTHNLIQAVHNREVLYALENTGRKNKKSIRVHIKVDTGMGRLGFRLEEIVDLINEIHNLKYIQIEGIFSHLAMSELQDKSYSLLQIKRFNNFKQKFNSIGDDIPYWHICNSGGIVDLSQAHYNMVRCGLLLYGLYPSETVSRPLDLKPVLTWKSRIVALKTVFKGESVSYGRHWIAQKEERIGVIPLGYHDGYDRKLTNIGEVLVRNRRVNVIGDVCMDNLMILGTNIPDVEVGDEVVLIGKMGNDNISPLDVARWSDTISYEVICRIGRRIPRIYLWENKELSCFSFLDPLGQMKFIENKSFYSNHNIV
jgi:alanine racemase